MYAYICLGGRESHPGPAIRRRRCGIYHGGSVRPRGPSHPAAHHVAHVQAPAHRLQERPEGQGLPTRVPRIRAHLPLQVSVVSGDLCQI